MPKNKSAVERYYVIDSCLTNPYKRYPDKIHILDRISERLGVVISGSMLDKDFAEMKAIYDAPIKYSNYHKGYYYTQEGFSITKLPLTTDEIAALDYSTSMLSLMKGTKLRERCEAAIDKLITGYRATKADGVDLNVIQIEEPVSTPGSQWMETIIGAIIEKDYCLQIDYRSFGGETKTHLISPYLLKEYRNRWYVVGHSNRSGKVLLLALDRIQSIQSCNHPYTKTDDFSPADFFKYSFGITQFNTAKPEKVVLQFTPYQAPYIESQLLHHSQTTLKRDKNGLKVQLEVYITHELTSTILGYGTEVKVLAPASLKKEIKRIATQVATY